MTVKQLKDILEGCNDDAVVIVVDYRDRSIHVIQDEDVFHSADATTVSIHLIEYEVSND